MRRLFNVIFQLISAAIVIFLLTAVWIVFDGLTDLGEKADVAWVFGSSQPPRGASDPLLDRVIKLYTDGDFPFIVVSGSTHDQADVMAKYLESHDVPASAILKGAWGENTLDTARNMAETMKLHQFKSVMIVTDYYYVTRTKLELLHEGITDVQKAHVGKLHKADAMKIGREVVALYDFVAKDYLLPAAEKAREEAQVGIEKAKANADQAKKKMDKGLDNMSK